jgi:uncharacterized protein (TIGR03382 family)
MAPVFRPGIAPVPGGTEGQYELRHLRSRALFTDKGVELHLPSRTQQVRTLGWSVAGGRAVQPRADKPRETKLHRLVGPAKSWEREVPTYGGVRYPGVLPGVELWFEERAEGVEYGFRAERGADLRKVKLEYAGARQVRVVEQGRALEVEVGEGVLREQGLKCEQEREDGTKKEVGCRFTQARAVGPERWTYAIEVDVEDPERPVVVDPLVLWNTYLGSAGQDELRDMALNDEGDVFIVGTVGGTSLSPPVDAGLGASDVLVARFHGDGGLAWSTLLGGSGEDYGRAIELGGSGEVYVAGATSSTGLAVKMPVDELGTGSTLRGNSDGFVAQLSSSGTLDWFMYFGGTGDGGEQVNDIVLAPDGRLILVGETTSEDLPGTSGTRTVVGTEAFMVPLTPKGPDKPELGVGFLLMGSGSIDSARSVAANDEGVFIAGTSNSSDFPKGFFGVMRTTHAGQVDAFALKVRMPMGIPEWGVFLGGAGSDEGHALVCNTVDGTPCVVAGTTDSGTFAGDSTDSPANGIFVLGVESFSGSPGSPLRLQGSSSSEGIALALDKDQRVYVAGRAAPGFSADGGFDGSRDGGTEAFVARVQLEPSLEVPWSSYVGGGGEDEIFALKIDPRNRLFIGGATTSTNLRYADTGYDLNHDGKSKEMFLLAVDLDTGVPGGGGTDGGGTDGGGTDGGGSDGGEEGEEDAGQPDAGTGTPRESPLGWSCSAGGGPGVLALGVVIGVALQASRRRRRAPASRG